MAQYQDGVDVTMTSTWDLSAKQYRAVIVDTGNNRACLVASQALDPIVGVVQNKPASGQAARVRVAGTSKVQVGANVARGDLLVANATGFVIKGNSQYLLGWAIETVNSGGFCEAIIQPGQATA